MKTGIHHNISHNDYHALTDIVSNSYLGRLAKVPAAAKIPQEETEAMRFGRAIHVFILEGETEFIKQYCICEDRGKRSKEDKAYWVEMLVKHESQELIKFEDFEVIKKMNNAVMSHPFAAKLLAEGISETTLIWKDEETGLMCKARPDRIPAGNKGTILDLKSTTNAAKNTFQNDCVKFGYAREGAIYLEGLGRLTGALYTDLIFACIAVEKTEPYRTEVYTIEADFLEWGYGEFHRLLQIEKQCRDNNFWSHYNNAGAESLFRPAYLKVWEYNELPDEQPKDFLRGDR
jgi:hypothetical protein